MDPEKTFSLVKELEKINSSKSKYSLSGAIITLIVAIIFLSALFYKILSFQSQNSSVWVLIVFFVISIIMMLQSIFIIINHRTDKIISTIVQAVLEIAKGK
jgi:membrane protein YdbS with pleckstrin-like domain